MRMRSLEGSNTMAFAEPEALATPAVALRKLMIHNRLGVPVAAGLLGSGEGEGRSPALKVPACATETWSIRRNDRVRVALTGRELDAVLELDLTDGGTRHLIIDEAGARALAHAERQGPDHADGIRRVQVGCGPKNLFPDWWNVDIRSFKGVDAVMDVTQAWPYQGLDYVYGEHFIEHLPLAGAVKFLVACGQSLRPGGVLRLTTPNLEWVVRTHYPTADDGDKVTGTYAVNRAFHGWGHQFLYSQPFLKHVLKSLGYAPVTFYKYGQSPDPALRNLERHGGYKTEAGVHNLLVVEAVNSGAVQPSEALEAQLQSRFMRYVDGGH
jgi:predicted SAM-dependent methyltransferase